MKRHIARVLLAAWEWACEFSHPLTGERGCWLTFHNPWWSGAYWHLVKYVGKAHDWPELREQFYEVMQTDGLGNTSASGVVTSYTIRRVDA